MSLAVITDSSVNLPADIQGHADVYILDIPVIIGELRRTAQDVAT